MDNTVKTKKLNIWLAYAGRTNCLCRDVDFPDMTCSGMVNEISAKNKTDTILVCVRVWQNLADIDPSVKNQ